MLLVNSVLDSTKFDGIEKETKQALVDMLKTVGIDDYNFYTVDNQNLMFVYLDSEISLKTIREIYQNITEVLNEIRVVLVFDKINGSRKKKFEEEKISFSVRNKEIKVF